jgi:hypothetical protein
MINDLSDHIQLMVAWEKEVLLGQSRAFFPVKSHKMLYDIGDAFSGEHFIPEVGSLVPKRIDGIALAKVLTQKKRQKEGGLPIQLGSHVCLVGIDGKVYDAPPKTQQRLCTIPLVLVLVLSVNFGILPSSGIFEFRGGKRKSIHKKQHIDFLQRISRRIP